MAVRFDLDIDELSVPHTVRGDCLDHLIPLSERHLRAILTEFVHY